MEGETVLGWGAPAWRDGRPFQKQAMVGGKLTAPAGSRGDEGPERHTRDTEEGNPVKCWTFPVN